MNALDWLAVAVLAWLGCAVLAVALCRAAARADRIDRMIRDRPSPEQRRAQQLAWLALRREEDR